MRLRLSSSSGEPPRGLLYSAGAPQPASMPGSLRILIADDERDSVTTLLLLLREDGHDVRTAYNGKDALRVAREFDPDAVLLDIAMPEVNGWDVARAIRARSGKQRPLLIAVTGKYMKTPDRILGSIAGFDHYLVKPYDPQTLLGLLAPLRSPR